MLNQPEDLSELLIKREYMTFSARFKEWVKE